MGKIVKFCNSCDEGFAEKFGFCPNCGGKLSAYEMNPISEVQPVVEETKSIPVEENPVIVAPPILETPIIEAKPILETPIVEAPIIAKTEEIANFTDTNETVSFTENKIAPDEPIFESNVDNEVIWDDLIEENKPSNVTISSGFETKSEYEAMPSSMYQQNFNQNESSNNSGFHITIIEDKKKNRRRAMLLGFGVAVISVFCSYWVYSLFTTRADVAALGGSDSLYSLIPDVEAQPIEKEELEKNKDKGGGGGGGGRGEEDPVSKGRLASQTEQPLINPDKSIVRRDNPELRQERATTQGKEFNEKQSDEDYGNPNSTNFSRMSNGTGSGGGQGEGFGQGQGNGRGTGRGNGEGSGMGNGKGNGRGNGTGPGSGDGNDEPPPNTPRKPTPPPATPKPAGVTQGLKIISQPKPGYTEEGRKNNASGTVRLRVTFNANGSIGLISPVSTLPYGLTEKAIAAAQSIRFEPRKVDGVPQTSVKVIEYTFTIY